jgi:hypothetical protein
MKRPGLQTDERSASIFQKVCTALYIVTVVTLWLDVLYRQLWLRQAVTEFLDLALILTFNVVLSIAAILYAGGISIPKIHASLVALFYGVCVVAGTLFWIVKDPDGSQVRPLAKLLIIASTAAIFVLLYLLAAWLGTRNAGKELDD